MIFTKNNSKKHKDLIKESKENENLISGNQSKAPKPKNSKDISSSLNLRSSQNSINGNPKLS